MKLNQSASKKRIGILTYHRSVNYGAYMQAYSLSRRIQEDFPDCKVEIIDYVSERAYRIYHKGLKNDLMLILKSKNMKDFKTHIKMLIKYILKTDNQSESKNLEPVFQSQLKYLPLSDELIVTDDVNQFCQKVKGKYDVIVVGSDAVWNWQIRTFPSPNFLKNDCCKSKMSYAASSYGQDYLSITDYQREYIKSAWDTFKYIGVRDIPTENFVKFIDPKLQPVHNCDPTVFLNMDTVPVDMENLANKIKSYGIDLDKPIIGLMAKPQLGEIVKKLFGGKYQIVSVFFDDPSADFYLDGLTPFEWSRVFSFFDVTFTHFFHGNLLSLKNGTPTIPIEQKSHYNQTHDSKIRDLMKRINRLDWCFYQEDLSGFEEDIIQKVESCIGNKKYHSDMIFSALKNESESYDSFKEALTQILK